MKACGKKLGIKKTKKIFLYTGAEISAIDEIQNDDMLYVSCGEAFYKNAGPVETGQETFHVSVLGSGGVGKSAITLRFVRDFFVKDWDPTIEDAYRKTVDVDDKLCMLEILDTAGQDDFESLRPQWMMDKDGYVFVFALDSAASLAQLEPFFELHKQINEGKTVPIVLAGNKKDRVEADPSKREVTEEEARAVARRYGAAYIEASALKPENIVETFELFVREVRKVRSPTVAPERRRICTLL
jgi:GTPase KRas protein